MLLLVLYSLFIYSAVQSYALLKIDCVVSTAAMENMDEHDSDANMPLGIDSDGAAASRFRKKRSKVWV